MPHRPFSNYPSRNGTGDLTSQNNEDNRLWNALSKGVMTLHRLECLTAMKQMPENSVDSIVTDPPYELGFMGKSWDNAGIAYSVEMWSEALRILKPGGHLLAFGGTRTYHRMACAIEDAGFEIRDSIHWIYGSGFPKSHNLKDEWQGWGTALKPAHEPIVVARKPLIGTVAANVLEYGTGALNIDASRITIADGDEPSAGHRTATFGTQKTVSGGDGSGGWQAASGRWPANVIFDEDAGAKLEKSRFFYCAKASKFERNAGLEGLEEKEIGGKGNGLARTCGTCGTSVLDGCDCPDQTFNNPTRQNLHPTVKPLALMRYLVRLVTPPGGVVFDPFLGSGTTAVAAILEGFEWAGCEMTEDYWPIIEARTKWAKEHPPEIKEPTLFERP